MLLAKTFLLSAFLARQPQAVTCSSLNATPTIDLSSQVISHTPQQQQGAMVTAPANTTNVYIFLARKEGTTMDEFKDYYETTHVPLIATLVFDQVPPLSYRRNYINRDDPASLIGGFASSWIHDCVMTVVCQDIAHRNALLGNFKARGAAIAANEAHLLDRSKSLIILPSESMDTFP